jgi:paraquat-inducible protein B
MAVITIPRVLREKLGEDGADTLVELLNLANEKVKEDVIELSAEKFERRLTEEIAQLRGEFKEEIAQLRSVDLAKLDKRITEEMAQLRGEFKEEIAQLRSVDLANLDKRITEEMAKVNQRITDEVAKLDNKISDVKVDLIKWQVGMFVTTVILILGLYATIIFK